MDIQDASLATSAHDAVASEPRSKGSTLPGTLEKILSAAETEFGNAGFDAARIQDIARRAGLSKQIIYSYYKTKEILFEEVYKRTVDRNRMILMHHDYEAMPPDAAFRLYFISLFETYRINPTRMATDVWQHWGTPKIFSISRFSTSLVVKRLTSIVERGVAAGMFRPDVDVQRLFCNFTAVSAGCISSAGLMSRLFDHDYDSKAALDEWQNYYADVLLSSLLLGPERRRARPKPARSLPPATEQHPHSAAG